MSKQANAGELRTLVYFRRVIRDSDEEGCPREREEPVFGYEGPGRERAVHCKWVNAHGTEVFTAMQLKVRQPATLTMRYSPLIRPTLLAYKGNDPVPYEVVSVDDVEDRHRWMEVTVQRKVAAR